MIGASRLLEPLHQVPQVPPRLRIEPGRRLVQKQQLRVAHQRARHRQPLLLPAGEPADARPPLFFELRRPDRFIHREAAPKKTAKQPQHFFHRQLVRKLRLLQLNPDSLPQLLRARLPVQAQQLHQAFVRRGQPFANFNGRRLPRPVRPQQSETLPLRHFQIQPIHRPHVVKRLP